MTSASYPRMFACAAAALLLLMVGRQALAVDFKDSLEAARAADTLQRPIVVSFGAAWCGWCRKMEVNTFKSPEVEELAGKFLWVKVDVDEQKELAARYHVHGLPHTIVLDAKNRTIAEVGGYLPPDKFVRFLTESLTNPQPGRHSIDDLLEKLRQADSDDKTGREGIGNAEIGKIVKALVEVIARPSRQGRDEVLASFKMNRLAVQPVLLDLMADDRLAVRAAASHSLKHCLESGLAFDPFADLATRTAQLADWQKAVDAAARDGTTR